MARLRFSEQDDYMWYVYILKSTRYIKSYVGCTDNIERRLLEHNLGKSYYTSRYKPWEILKFELFKTYLEARKRERFYKTGKGREELKKLF
jgi:putative endonuclease